MDWRGFGLSGGARLNTSFVDNHKDLAWLLDEFDPTLPLFIYGHSMGGSIVTSFMMNNPKLKVAGIILSAPPLAMNENLNCFMKGFVWYGLGELKEFVMTAKINPFTVSRKPEFVRKMLTDKLIVPATGGYQLSNLCKLLYSLKYNVNSLAVPTYLNLGGLDKIVNNKAAEKFYDMMSCKKRLSIYLYAKHELHIDATKELHDNMLEWMDRILASNCPTLGNIKNIDFRVGHLKKAQPY
jgi:acylglycerol lipase